jgi:hydrogenase nickel incorporation protein HypB
MCETCGCDGDHHEHVHADGTVHSHDHPHHHHEVDLKTRVLAKNDALAARNRGWFAGREILALNLLSAPGAGKTTLLERTIQDLQATLCVIEGDQATSRDADRIRALGTPVVQVNTGTGCHLDAEMVARGLEQVRPQVGSVLMIENVGNLVCPALFDLGEWAKVVVFSATEGEDKPLKYPHMFRAAGLVLLNKADLLPHLDFDPAAALANLRQVNQEAPVLQVSARTGAGMEAWYDWIGRQLATVREAAFA